MPNIDTREPKVERVDGIPLVYGQLEKMGVQEIIDRAIKPHGNWEGLSPGWLMTLWLVHILSEQNHKMEPVQLWAKSHQYTLERVSGQAVSELDFTDDRLAMCLRDLSDIKVWHEIEEELGMRCIRIYDLNTDILRLDATTGTVYHDPSESSILKVGKAKNGLYETQFKIMMASLDPLGFGFVVDVEAGNRADDPLYIPCYERAKGILDRNGMLVVGDSKMSAKETRATIQAGEDYYLTPLADKKDEPELMQELLDEWLKKGAKSVPVFLAEDIPEDGGPPDPTLAIACAFEVTRRQTSVVKGKEVSWDERLVVVCSYDYKKSMLRTLRRRIDKAEAALIALTPPRGRGRKQIQEEAKLLTAINEIETKYRVKGFFEYSYQQEVKERHVRPHRGKPARVERQVRYQLSVSRVDEAISRAESATGWRIYATNASKERLSLTQVVLAYRGQIVQENIFRRLHGKFLSLTPLYVQRDDHAQGLIHLLTIGARVLALGDYLAREALALENAELADIYTGNSNRSTPRPTTERMINAFEGIDLIITFPHSEHDHDGHSGEQVQHVSTILTGLKPVHERILGILGLPFSLYSCLRSA